jgi:hypothetical protein
MCSVIGPTFDEHIKNCLKKEKLSMRIIASTILILTLLGILVLLGSCLNLTEPDPPRAEPWLCSINADGTGFRKIKKVDSSFGTNGFWDIYMTKDDRIIFYGEKLWISDTDSINVAQITPDDLTMWKLPTRLSQSPDGSKLFFAADKNIYELSYPGYQLSKLTDQTIRWLRNPMVSDLGNYITYSSRGYGTPAKFTEYLYWMNINSGKSGIIPTIDSICVNSYYSETEDYVYYEGVNIKRSRLDGSELSVVTTGGSMYPYASFDLSSDLRHIIHIWDETPTLDVLCFDKQLNTAIRLPIKQNSNADYLARICKNVNKLFYVRPAPGVSQLLCVYDLDSGEYRVLTDNIANFTVGGFEMIAPSWDGSKVFFYAYVGYK